MINLLLGRPGSGKSYEAVVFHILPALADGRKVITNLPLNLDVIFTFFPDYQSLIQLRYKSLSGDVKPFSHVSDFKDDWRGKDGIGPLYVIDECHKYFPSSGTPRAIDEWFAEHRHLGVDVLLITQSYRKLSRSIVDMIQVVYRLSNNRTLGSDKSYIRKVQDGVRGEVLSTQIRTYEPAKFKFYKSHTKTNSSVIESQAKDIKPLWKNWSFVGAAIFLGLGVPYFVYNLINHNPITKPLENVKKPVFVKNQVSNNDSLKLPASTPSDVKKTALPEPVKALDIVTPFGRVSLHIGGFIRSELSKKYFYQFIASQNGQSVFTLSQNDLISAGYFIRPLGSCSVELIYQDVKTYVICDAPRTGTNVQQNFAVQ